MTTPKRPVTAAELLDAAEVERLALRPGDILVFKCPMPLADADFETIRDRLREGLPESTKVLVLDNGADLAVLRAEP